MAGMRRFRLRALCLGRIVRLIGGHFCMRRKHSQGDRMRLDLDTPLIALDTGKVVALRDAQGIRIQPREGTVWVTEEGDARDHIVNAGEALVVGRPGLTLVQALTPSWVKLAA
jgi:hypothetical protein